MIAIKGIEKQTDCKKCPLMGTDGDPKDSLSPMMCIGIWATTREIKHCTGGSVREDCPLVEIVTCKDCKYYRRIELNSCDEVITFCEKHSDRNCRYTSPNFFCAEAKRRE